MNRCLILLGVLASAPALSDERPPSAGHRLPLPSSAPGGPAISPGAAYLNTLSRGAREALLRDGQVILDASSKGSGPTMVKAVARFARPRDEVYALITQPHEQHRYLPHVKVSRPIGERTKEGEREDFEVSFLFTFKYRSQHWYYPEEDRVEWVLDPSGGDGLKEQVGYWQLYELDEHTTVAEYGTHIRVRGAFLDFIRGLGERGTINEALTAFRRHVDTAPLPTPAASGPAVGGPGP